MHVGYIIIIVPFFYSKIQSFFFLHFFLNLKIMSRKNGCFDVDGFRQLVTCTVFFSSFPRPTFIQRIKSPTCFFWLYSGL